MLFTCPADALDSAKSKHLAVRRLLCDSMLDHLAGHERSMDLPSHLVCKGALNVVGQWTLDV